MAPSLQPGALARHGAPRGSCPRGEERRWRWGGGPAVPPVPPAGTTGSGARSCWPRKRGRGFSPAGRISAVKPWGGSGGTSSSSPLRHRRCSHTAPAHPWPRHGPGAAQGPRAQPATPPASWCSLSPQGRCPGVLALGPLGCGGEHRRHAGGGKTELGKPQPPSLPPVGPRARAVTRPGAGGTFTPAGTGTGTGTRCPRAPRRQRPCLAAPGCLGRAAPACSTLRTSPEPSPV